MQQVGSAKADKEADPKLVENLKGVEKEVLQRAGSHKQQLALISRCSYNTSLTQEIK